MHHQLPRRGLSMYVVFLIVAMATLVTAGLAFRAGADRDGAGHAVQAVQVEALVRSGMAGLMAELDDARDTILAGDTPHITDRWSLYSTGTERGEIVVLPWESDDSGLGNSSERLIISESAKLDINAADAEQLTRLFEAAGASGDIEQLARAVVSTRGRLTTGCYLSLGDVVALGAIPADVMWGISEDASEDGTVQHRPLCDLLTVHGYEPVLQETGKYKINVNAAWDDRMGQRIARRFGEELAALVRQVKQNEDFSITETQLMQLLAQSDDPPNEWDQYVDAFTDSDEKFYHGRVDLNRASPEVLYAVTGFDEDTISAIVAGREELSSRQQGGTTWLVELGIVEPGVWASIATRLTTRTFAWRARVMARILRGGADNGQQPTTVEAERLYEIVIDLSAPRPRLAYVRDITMQETAVQLVNRYGNSGPAESVTDENDTFSESPAAEGTEPDDGLSPDDIGGEDATSADDGSDNVRDARSDEGPSGNARSDVKDRSPTGRWTRGG